MVKSFLSSTQSELLNRNTWRTRVDPARAVFDYTEIFYNRKRRLSNPGYDPDRTRRTLQLHIHLNHTSI